MSGLTKNDITFGDNWRHSITSGITECDRFFSFLPFPAGTTTEFYANAVDDLRANPHTFKLAY